MTQPQATRNKLLSRGGLAPVAWETGDDLKSSGDMTFCSLHHHTTFSYLDGFGTPEQHMLQAAKLGIFGMGVTDHGNVTAHAQWEQAGDKHGVKPLFGCEFYAGDIGERRGPKKNHLTVLAETQDGYQNLLRMVSRAWAEGYYYQPTIDGSLLRQHSEGLIVLSGCQGSLLATSLVGGKHIDPGDASYARGRTVARRFHRLLGDGYYLEVQAFPELEATRNINVLMARLSAELGIPMVATMDAHYTTPDEGQMQNILHSVRSGAKKSAEDLAKEWGYDVPLCPLADADIIQRLIHTGLTKRQAQQAVRHSREIAERCTVRLPKVTNLQYPLPPGIPDNVTLFRKWLNDGWKYRGFGNLQPSERAEYVARVKYEMGLIEEKGFVDYFLVMADATSWAKDNEIPVGPARGSAAASLVCYLLRITEINPMLFPILVFERFIDKNRFDFPDIDLDFDDERRHLVREYLIQKYGADRVGNIGTFVRYKGKNSLNDVQMAKYRDQWDCKADLDTIKGLIIERKSGDLRPNATIEDTAEMFPQVAEIFEKWPELLKSQLLEGNVRGMSVHAAGIVVANEPLTRFCAIYTKVDANGKVKLDDNGDPQQVISLDKYDVEYLNALKIDALGLKTMAMIRICLEQIGMTLAELYAIPLDDPETIQGFKDQDVDGVFQYDGRAARQVNAGVKPDNFLEICHVNTLLRPGPLHSGATGDFIDIKHGRKEATRWHPIVDEITKYTHGQIIYQEQILQICRELGGFSWVEAARIRKIISKKRGQQEFNTMRKKFVSGALEHGMDADAAGHVFDLMATAGSYVFNAAHCVVGHTVVTKGGGYTDRHITIQELYDRPKWRQKISILAQDEDGRIRPVKIRDVYYQGVQETFRVSLANGRSVEATADHLILTEQGWMRVDELDGHWVIGNAGKEEVGYKGHNRLADGPYSGFSKGKNGQYALWRSWRDQAGDACEMCDEWHDRLETSHKDANRKNNDWSNLQLLCPRCHRNYDMEHNGARYGGWHKGFVADSSPVVSVVSTGLNPVYDIEVDGPLHNFVANDIVIHNCVSYGMLAYWTMWLKRNYPREFFVASLRKFPDRVIPLLRDALRHDIPYSSISLTSEANWNIDEADGTIQAGWLQVPNIGEVTARNIMEFLTSVPKGKNISFKSFQAIKGIGPKTVEQLETFSELEDPFGIHHLKNKIDRTTEILQKGIRVKDEDGRFTNPGHWYNLPVPTCKAEDVPYDKMEKDYEGTWMGVIKYRNLKDLFEVHHSKTGEVLDPDSVRRPDLNEWVTMEGEDDTGVIHISVGRFVYQQWKDDVWSIDIDNDLVLVRGRKWRMIARRMLSVEYMWVLED